MVFLLIYTCALRDDVGPSELNEIAKASRERNRATGLTGILLCKEGSVLQVLEGDEKAVMHLYERIAADPRVSNMLILFKRTSTKREFPKWSMGYRNADDKDACFNLTSVSFPSALPKDVSPEIRTISKTFARVNGLT